MRNSSLFEGFCADDVPGLKSVTEAVAPVRLAGRGGRGSVLFISLGPVRIGSLVH